MYYSQDEVEAKGGAYDFVDTSNIVSSTPPPAFGDGGGAGAYDAPDVVVAQQQQPRAAPPPIRRSDPPAKKEASLDLNTEFASRDWNKELNAIKDDQMSIRSSDRQQSALASAKIARLAREFTDKAVELGQKIIEQLHSPQKGIRSSNVGGVAGGDKYFVGGIFFKFTRDTEGIYGSDENACKSASHELKGATAFIQYIHQREMSFPLMAIVTHMGYRLIATSMLPIGKDTLRYGSADAGATIHSDDARIATLVAQICRDLNLKPHEVFASTSDHKEIMHGPGDIEGHRGKDGRIYVVDLARVFPSQAPRPGRKNSFLYELFRPEFLRKYPKPLSSDSFCKWAHNPKDDSVIKTINGEIREATTFFLEKTIAQCAEMLDKASLPSIGDDIYTTSFASMVRFVLFLVHYHGVNYRYLNAVRYASKNPQIKALMLQEIVARSCASLLEEKMRQASTKSQQQGMKAAVINIFCHSLNKLQNSVTGKTRKFWGKLQEKMEYKFAPPAGVLSDYRTQLHTVISTRGDLRAVIQRLGALMGVEYTPEYIARLSQDSGSALLSPADIKDVHPVTKCLFFILFQEGYSLQSDAENATDEETRKELLTQACIKYFSCLEAKPANNPFALHNLRVALTYLEKHKPQYKPLAQTVTELVEVEAPYLSNVSIPLYRMMDLIKLNQGSAGEAQAGAGVKANIKLFKTADFDNLHRDEVVNKLTGTIKGQETRVMITRQDRFMPTDEKNWLFSMLTAVSSQHPNILQMHGFYIEPQQRDENVVCELLDDTWKTFEDRIYEEWHKKKESKKKKPIKKSSSSSKAKEGGEGDKPQKKKKRRIRERVHLGVQCKDVTACALNIALNVAETVAFLQEKGINLPFISPQHLWIKNTGEVKVAIFNAVSIDDQRYALLTTPAMLLIPPDIFQQCTPTTVGYSLASLTHMLLTTIVPPWEKGSSGSGSPMILTGSRAASIKDGSFFDLVPTSTTTTPKSGAASNGMEIYNSDKVPSELKEGMRLWLHQVPTMRPPVESVVRVLQTVVQKVTSTSSSSSASSSSP